MILHFMYKWNMRCFDGVSGRIAPLKHPEPTLAAAAQLETLLLPAKLFQTQISCHFSDQSAVFSPRLTWNLDGGPVEESRCWISVSDFSCLGFLGGKK